MIFTVVAFLPLFSIPCSANDRIQTSPDKKSSVEYLNGKLNIYYRGDKKIYSTAQLEAPIIWSPNSEYILTISHIAHGEILSIIDLKNRNLLAKDIFPPIENEKIYQDAYKIGSKVHCISTDRNAIKVNYYISFIYLDKETEYREYNFTYNITTKEIRDLSTKIISGKKYSKAPSK